MPNVNTVLKNMICRLAKKEIKTQTASTKQAVAQYRRDIARLKRQVRDQQKEIGFLKAQEQNRRPEPEAKDEPLDGVRFSARSVKAQRRRLKLSAADYGKLVGVSGLTIYNWELGKARPRKAQLAALVAVRGIGRREAAAKLDVKAEEERGTKKRRGPKRRKGG
jgi:DNA-binding transcriptional regulator YiaG